MLTKIFISPLKRYQKGVSNLVIGILIVAIALLGLLYLKARGIISIPSTISSVATTVNQTINPFSSDHSGYGIQIAASRYLDNATKIMQSFADAGYSAFIVSSEVNGKKMYQVRLGPYEHKAEAKAIKEQLKRRFSRNPYVKNTFIVYRD